MGRDYDRKWTDEQRDTVARGRFVDGLSMAAAGRLVQDANGDPMPRNTARTICERFGESYMLRDASAAIARLEALRLECAHKSALIIAASLKTTEQTTDQARQLRELDAMAATLTKQISGLRATVKPAPAKAEPAQNGRTSEDAALAAILGG
jgi:hypothetical protein